jgi:hypothetical protein
VFAKATSTIARSAGASPAILLVNISSMSDKDKSKVRANNSPLVGSPLFPFSQLNITPYFPAISAQHTFSLPPASERHVGIDGGIMISQPGAIASSTGGTDSVTPIPKPKERETINRYARIFFRICIDHLCRERRQRLFAFCRAEGSSGNPSKSSRHQLHRPIRLLYGNRQIGH